MTLAIIAGVLGGLGMCLGGFAIYRSQRRLNHEYTKREPSNQVSNDRHR
jgi:hypothetical protein